MSEMAVTDIVTAELLAKLAAVLEQPHIGVGPVEFVARARDAGIGLVDLDRQRCLIDERVYESALNRMRLWSGRALRWEQPAEIEPRVWRFVQGSL